MQSLDITAIQSAGEMRMRAELKFHLNTVIRMIDDFNAPIHPAHLIQKIVDDFADGEPSTLSDAVAAESALQRALQHGIATVVRTPKGNPRITLSGPLEWIREYVASL